MSLSSLPSPPPSPQLAPLPASSSSVTGCPELELSVTSSPTAKSSRALKPRPPRQQVDQSQHKHQHVRNSNAEVRSEQPGVIGLLPEAQQPVRGSKDHRHAFRAAAPSCLDRVELNTSRVLQAQLLSLKREEFDSKRAVQETLQRSETTKNLISARATEGVNVSRSQQLFTSLVSISVQEDQLLHDKYLQALPPHSPSVTTTVEGPSLLLFTPSDQPREKPLPPEEEPAAHQPAPRVRPASSTFELYRRARCWEATP